MILDPSALGRHLRSASIPSSPRFLWLTARAFSKGTGSFNQVTVQTKSPVCDHSFDMTKTRKHEAPEHQPNRPTDVPKGRSDLRAAPTASHNIPDALPDSKQEPYAPSLCPTRSLMRLLNALSPHKREAFYSKVSKPE